VAKPEVPDQCGARDSSPCDTGEFVAFCWDPSWPLAIGLAQHRMGACEVEVDCNATYGRPGDVVFGFADKSEPIARMETMAEPSGAEAGETAGLPSDELGGRAYSLASRNQNTLLEMGKKISITHPWCKWDVRPVGNCKLLLIMSCKNEETSAEMAAAP